MSITKIVITGGPCAGKTTAMSRIEESFTKLGYRVLFVPESATELISGGVSPVTCGTNLAFQQGIMRLQLTKESVFEEAAATMDSEKILIVCDRGVLDNKAYMTEEEFSFVAKSTGFSEVELRDGYDGVFHLVTAAKGAEKYYTTANNSARTEDIATAVSIDDRLISAWTGHPHFRVIDNSSDFEGKLRRLEEEIRSFLGEPEPFEIERKFLIRRPDISRLEADPHCRALEITQTYLTAPEGEELRVRRRGVDGSFIYFKTSKRPTEDGLRRIEVESRITCEEYEMLLSMKDPSRRPIEKTRYCLTYENQYFEIDLYPFFTDTAIMEIELCREDIPVIFPDFIDVIEEVTGDVRYKNSTLAKI